MAHNICRRTGTETIMTSLGDLRLWVRSPKAPQTGLPSTSTKRIGKPASTDPLDIISSVGPANSLDRSGTRKCAWKKVKSTQGSVETCGSANYRQKQQPIHKDKTHLIRHCVEGNVHSIWLGPQLQDMCHDQDCSNDADLKATHDVKSRKKIKKNEKHIENTLPGCVPFLCSILSRLRSLCTISSPCLANHRLIPLPRFDWISQRTTSSSC